jgi:hypothetical protein
MPVSRCQPCPSPTESTIWWVVKERPTIILHSVKVQPHQIRQQECVFRTVPSPIADIEGIRAVRAAPRRRQRVQWCRRHRGRDAAEWRIRSDVLYQSSFLCEATSNVKNEECGGGLEASFLRRRMLRQPGGVGFVYQECFEKYVRRLGSIASLDVAIAEDNEDKIFRQR